MDTIVIGSDHAGYKAKEELKAMLQKKGFNVIDVGTTSEESTDYPDYAVKVGEAVSSGQAKQGVLVCGTGIGMCMTANKIRGVRAALVTDDLTAEMSRKHNDANVFCAGARVLATEKMKQLLDKWLSTPFEGGRHERRVQKMMDLDNPSS
jgi:ribose 5-phosphate isomerase B